MADVIPMRKSTREVVSIVPSPEEQQKTKALLARIQRAEQDLQTHRNRIDLCYQFALPWRHKRDSIQPTDQLDGIYDDTAMTVVEDFSADMLNTFTPMKSEWIEIKPAITMDVGDARMLEAPLKAYKDVLFSEMRRSNLFQAIQECYLDLAIGTMAMSITDPNPAEPIHCEAIPAGSELLIDKGPYGKIAGIWRKQTLRGEECGVLWPDAKRPKSEDRCWEPDDAVTYQMTDGLHRDWSKPATEAWCYVVLCNGRMVYEKDYSGKGSCQMIVARWSRDSTTAWGVGPLYRTTPSVKALNYMQEKFLKLFDKTVDPPVSYVDDGVINLDTGIEAGMWIARASGSDAPEAIESQNRFDFGYVQRDDLMHAIKRAHYQDRPEQLGKTPPSATQWADEAAERARRMGTPATNLVHEWQYAIVNRFAYLLAKRGRLPKIELNGKEITLEPVSPLLRAQEQEEVVSVNRFVEMVVTNFPQVAPVVLKPMQIAQYLALKMGVPLGLINTETEIKQAMQQMAPLIQGAMGGGAPPGGAPPGAPPPGAPPA